MSCEHRKDGRCTQPIALPQFGSRVSETVCKGCPHYEGPLRGLGDAIAKVTKTIGIKTCGSCQKRREALNGMLPMGGIDPVASRVDDPLAVAPPEDTDGTA